MPRRKRKCFRPACHVRFVPGRVDQKYHDMACRNKHWRELHPRVMILEERGGRIVGARSSRTARVVLHEKVGAKR